MTHSMIRSAGLALLLASAAFTAACDKPTKDKPAAQVAEAVSATPAAATAGALTYKFGPPDSKVGFVGAKVTGKHEGSFGKFSGDVRLVDNDVTKSAVNVDIDMTSLKADDEKLTGHLKSPDFFNVESFPKATFTSTSIRPGGDKGATHTITGNLQLHGVTKSISFPATIKVEADHVEAAAEFGINRKDFGVVYPGKPDDLIRDDVLIKLSLKASKANG